MKTLRCMQLGSHSTSVQNSALCATWFPQDFSKQHCNLCHLVPKGHLYKTLRWVLLGSHSTSLHNSALCHLVPTGLVYTTLRSVSLSSHRKSLHNTAVLPLGSHRMSPYNTALCAILFPQDISIHQFAVCHLVPKGRPYKTLRFVPLVSHRTPLNNSALSSTRVQRTSLYNIALCSTWFSQDVSIQHCALCHLIPTGHLYTTVRFVPLVAHRKSLYKTAFCVTCFQQDVSIQDCALCHLVPTGRLYASVHVCHLVLTGRLYTTLRCVPLGSRRTSL